MPVTVRTNNVPRDIIEAWELSEAEREEFDYLDWSEFGTEPNPATSDLPRSRSAGDAEFFRYRGQLYDLGEFSADYGITRGAGLPPHLARWDGYMSETFFSAIVVRYVDNFERVIVGHVLS